MDDELKAIQDDLDSVLDRLSDYMASDKLHTEFVQWDGATREDAAAVICSYAGTYGACHYVPMSLDGVIHLFRSARAWSESRKREYQDAYGNELGAMVSAISMLAESDAIPNGCELNLLQIAANDYMAGRAKWFGQAQGVPLVRTKRKYEAANPPLVIDGYLDKDKNSRLTAAMEVFFYSRNTKAPIDDGLFELAGEHFGIKPGTLKACYYSDQAKQLRNGHKISEDVLGFRFGQSTIEPP